MMTTNDSKEETMSYDNIVEQLKSNILQVTFTKVNGEERVMPCTLLPGLLPTREQGETAAALAVNNSVVRAFAIDKQAWRSFRVENVTQVEVINE